MNEFVTVYSAEMMRRLRSRIFVIGLIFGAIGIAIIMKFPDFINSYSTQAKTIVLSGEPVLRSRAAPLLAKDFTIAGRMPFTRNPRASDLETHGHAAAIVSVFRRPDGLGVAVFAKDPGNVETSAIRRDLLPLNLELSTNLPRQRVAAALRMPVIIHSLASKFGSAAQANQARIVAYLLLVFLYILIVINSQLIMSSVAEEKTSRIAELLIASVDPSALLAGKIAASATLAILQMIVWVVIGFALGSHPGAPQAASAADNTNTAQFSLSGISSGDIAGFVIFFLLGYLQMSTLFAAIGSLINRTEDLGSISGPLFIPVIAAFFIALSALAVPESPLVIATSFIPLIAPFVMFARIVVSDVPFWQIALSFAINCAAIYAIAILGGKIYRVGMLLYGRPPRFSQILSVLRT